MRARFRNSKRPSHQLVVLLLRCSIFTIFFLKYEGFAVPDSPTLTAPCVDSSQVETSSHDPPVDSEVAPSYIMVTTTTSGLLTRTDLGRMPEDGIIEGFNARRPVLTVPDMAAVKDPAEMAKLDSRLALLNFPLIEYVKVSDHSRLLLNNDGLCLREFESASVFVEKIHDFAGRHLLTLEYHRAGSLAGNAETTTTLTAESVTDSSMDPSGWQRRSQARLVCIKEHQFPILWPERAAIRYPGANCRQFLMVVSSYDRIERCCDGCDAEEFRTGPWLKRVKVTELTPLSTPAKRGGDSSYALLLNLSLTVPWLAERRSLSFESQPDSDDSGELDFDMEIFKREEDNRQVDSFVFEVDVKAYQPHHLAVAAGLLRGAVCILSREENSEKIDFRCPTLDRLHKQLSELFEELYSVHQLLKFVLVRWFPAVLPSYVGIYRWTCTEFFINRSTWPPEPSRVPHTYIMALETTGAFLERMTASLLSFAEQLEEQRSNIRKRSKAIAIAAWISTAVAALGIGSMVWGSTQPRRLRRTLDNAFPQLLEYQFRLSQQSALSDISRMASPSNMMKIWKARPRNPRAAIGGIAEGVGFWAFLSGLVAAGVAFTRKMRTVNIEEQANEKSRASLGQRIGSAAASAIERFRKGIASKLRVVFIVDDTL